MDGLWRPTPIEEPLPTPISRSQDQLHTQHNSHGNLGGQHISGNWHGHYHGENNRAMWLLLLFLVWLPIPFLSVKCHLVLLCNFVVIWVLGDFFPPLFHLSSHSLVLFLHFPSPIFFLFRFLTFIFYFLLVIFSFFDYLNSNFQVSQHCFFPSDYSFAF